MTLFRILILSAALLLDAAAWGAPALTDPLPIDPQVKLGKLDNGLTYYIHRNVKPAQRAELRLLVRAGSVLEDDDQRGLAHFVEHMGFKGSTHFKQHELVTYLQSIGVRFGADLNAFTGFDSTIYHLPIPTDKPGNLEQGIQVLEDWAHGMTLDPAAMEEERTIILEEKRLRSGYAARRSDAMLPKLANGTRYQERRTIGTEDSIAHATPQALRRFYADWYRPDLMAVIVVGDIDPAEVERMVRRHFGQIRMPAQPRRLPHYPLPPLQQPDSLVFIDKEAPANTVQLVYSLYQRQPPSTAGGYREELLRQVFSTLMSMRLTRLTMLYEPPLVQGAAGEGGLPFGSNQRMYTANATVGKAGVNAAVDALVRENRRVREFGFTDAELAVARSNVLAAYEARYKARDTRESAALLALYVNHYLAGAPIPGIAAEVEYARAWLPNVTLDEINAYALGLIPAGPPRLVLYSGSGEAPSGAELLARAQAAQSLPVTRLVDRPVPSSLMEYKPEPGSIVQQSEDKALGLTRLLLSNGVKVVLKPTTFSKDAVQMQAVRPGGQMLFPDADKNPLRFAAAVQGAMGVAGFTPSDLSRILAGKTANAGASMSAYADHLNGGCRSADIEAMLQLTYLGMTNPGRDERLFRAFVARNAEQVRNSRAAPEARFAEERLKTLYGGHPRVDLAPRAEDFETLNLERATSLFRSRMGSAKGMTFILVGDFEVEAIKPLLAQYLATLPTGEVALQYRDPGIRQVPGVVRREVRAGVEQKSVVSVDFSGDVPYSKEESLAFRALVNVLNIRIAEELREQRKLIYSGNASGRYEMVPRGSYALSVSLPAAPHNVAKVEAALWELIATLQDQGPQAADLDKVKQAMLQAHRKALGENGYWLQILRIAALEATDPADALTLETRLRALTAAQVQAAARRFLTRDHYVEMVLLPEPAAGTPGVATPGVATPGVATPAAQL
ncbi:M16 family metallopeptidase [Oxalobacteraceae bacterium A2-2]